MRRTRRGPLAARWLSAGCALVIGVLTPLAAETAPPRRPRPAKVEPGAKPEPSAKAAARPRPTPPKPNPPKPSPPKPNPPKTSPPKPGPPRPSPTGVPAAAEREVSIERTTVRLPGGATLVVVPLPSATLLTVAVVEGSGFAADPAGRGGLSNLASRLGEAAPAERRGRLVAERGGLHTLSVGPDDVVSTYVLPPGELELALWLEHDRLSARATEPALIDALRAIAEDRATRPFERHRERLDGMAFQGLASYAHAPDGAADELIAIRADLVTGKLPARPPRAIAVVVAGPVSAAQVEEAARRHVGAVPAGTGSPPPSNLPEQTNQRAATTTDARAAAPSVAMAFTLSPTAVEADGPALELAAALLTSGQGSRVGRALVAEGLVERAHAHLERRRGPSLFRLEAHLTASADPVLVRERLERMFGDLAKGAPRPDELARAAQSLALEEARVLDDPSALATRLGRAALRGDPPSRWRLDRWRGVDGNAVARAVALHLSPIRRNVLEVRPEHPVAPPVAPTAGPARGSSAPGAAPPPSKTSGKARPKGTAKPGTNAKPSEKPGVGEKPGGATSRPNAKPAKKRGAP